MVKYVVTGATGELGSRIFKYLIRLVPASDVIVSLYNPAGATPAVVKSGVEIRKGDFKQPDTLDVAFKGGDKLLMVSYPTINYEICIQNHKAAIDAAKRVGIKHIYYTSVAFAEDTKAQIMQAHIDTEAYLRNSGITYTIIREGIYSESFPLYFGFWNPSRGDEVRVPYGDGAISWVCREDLGEGTAKLLVSANHENETVLFTGSKAINLTELADIIIRLLNLDPPLKLKIVSEDEYVSSNEGGEELLRKWVTTFPALVRGELAIVDPLLREILGRELKPFEETVKEILMATRDGGADALKGYPRVTKYSHTEK